MCSVRTFCKTTKYFPLLTYLFMKKDYGKLVEMISKKNINVFFYKVSNLLLDNFSTDFPFIHNIRIYFSNNKKKINITQCTNNGFIKLQKIYERIIFINNKRLFLIFYDLLDDDSRTNLIIKFFGASIIDNIDHLNIDDSKTKELFKLYVGSLRFSNEEIMNRLEEIISLNPSIIEQLIKDILNIHLQELRDNKIIILFLIKKLLRLQSIQYIDNHIIYLILSTNDLHLIKYLLVDEGSINFLLEKYKILISEIYPKIILSNDFQNIMKHLFNGRKFIDIDYLNTIIFINHYLLNMQNNEHSFKFNTHNIKVFTDFVLTFAINKGIIFENIIFTFIKKLVFVNENKFLINDNFIDLLETIIDKHPEILLLDRILFLMYAVSIDPVKIIKNKIILLESNFRKDISLLFCDRYVNNNDYDLLNLKNILDRIIYD